jgi:transcriptional regulator with XRE-family HTH domain
MISRKRKQESDSPLEVLRIELTELSQDEFVVQCGISRTTYQRWVREKVPLDEIKLSPEQIVKMCRVCHISPKTFFGRLGVDLAGIPDDSPVGRQMIGVPQL